MVVIFDVDGVLIDVTKSYHYSIKDTVEYFTGIKKPKDKLLDIKFRFNINNDWDASVAGIIYALSGKPLENFKKDFAPYSQNIKDMYSFAEKSGIELPEYEKLVDVFEDFYHKHREREEMIFPHDVLERLRKKSDILGVITGRPFEDLDFSFKKFDLYRYFDYIITENDIPSPELRKPSSYPMKLFFEKVDFDNPVFYIGDTKADKKMVESYNREENKNVRFILYRNEHNRDIEGDFTIKSPEEICEVLNSYDYAQD
ncbi:HAD superfamily phosphatase [Persephonella hydrogeniphila]|uniref:phosphoglycolate phosphatase n=1 Tax=Persephonella hydrogeniphila TaxID=198703 RepID=A0A285NCI6_9AQUI|nr:HAD-IA family hydrolase [Persephonella hydrogeniphila]SNZ07160.1 HAD superfamily phosphatase [Persephonella hydrogeniphila]